MRYAVCELIKSDEKVTECWLRTYYALGKSEKVPDRIETHSGAWIREGKLWYWWKVEDDE